MTRFIFGLFTLLVLAAGAVLILLENPDRFKPQITSAAQAGTGYAMQINGELSWRYWPPVAIDVTGIELGVPGAKPFATFDAMSIDIDLMPLLTQQTAIDINEITLIGGRINLAIDADGHQNWTIPDTAADASVSPPSADDTGPAISPSVDQLAIEDVIVTYIDQQAESHFELGVTSLVTSRLAPDIPFDMSIDLNIKDHKEGLNARVSSTGQLLFKSDTANINFNELVSTVALIDGEDRYPEISFNNTGEWRAENRELVLNENAIRISSISMTTKGVVSLKSERPRFDGAVQIDIADPAQLSRDLDINLPVDFLQVKTDITATSDVINLVTMEGSFDESNMTGTAEIRNAKPFFMKADLRIDQLNTAKYLGTEETGGGGAAPGNANGDDSLIPFEMIRTRTLDATVRVATLEHAGQVFTDTKSTIKNLHWTLATVTNTNAFDGRIVLRTNTKLKEDGETRIRAALEKLDASQLIEYEGFSGRLSANTDLTFTGHSLNAIEETLTGKSNFNVANGTLDVRAIKNLAGTIERLSGKPSPISEWPDVMPFKRMVGEHRFIEGTRSGQVFSAEFENLQLSALGGFNLSSQSLGYDVSAIFNAPKAGQFDVGDDLIGVRWPMTCEGQFSEPPADLCFGQEGAISDIVSRIAAQELKRRGNEKLQEVLGDKVPDEYRELTEELFKNLFD